jgi:hypothetical protein
MKTIDVLFSHVLDDSMRELHKSVRKTARFKIYAGLQMPIYDRLFNISLENQIAEDINVKLLILH